MTRDESLLVDVLLACHLYWWDIHSTYKFYEVVGITENIVRIRYVYWDDEGEIVTTIDFNNDETLIESLLHEL